MIGNERSQPFAFATRMISATTSYSCFPGFAAAIAARYISRDTPIALSISATSAADLMFRCATTALCSGSERYDATIVGLMPSSAVIFSVCSARYGLRKCTRRPWAMAVGDARLELRHRRDRRDGRRPCLVRDGRLRAGPDDVGHREVVAEERLRVLVDVDQGRQPGQVDGEEVQERAVLPEVIRVGGVVHPDLVVAEEQDQAGADVLLEPAAAFAVDGGIEHGCVTSMNAPGTRRAVACSLDEIRVAANDWRGSRHDSG